MSQQGGEGGRGAQYEGVQHRTGQRTDGRTTVPVDSSFVLSMDFPERTIYSKVTGPWTMSGIGKRFWSSQYCIQYSTVQYNGIYSIDCEVVVAMKR
ncbi:hypothetical protein EYC84_003533 [Monilinia fructicola]|uniref:Uncharacterized protein n=1 Tax=Monilinia fructicola TaxID=38448 RepID=A0A5M9JTZ0_MONFR|nr:hypothetical protein EYC84_003533 [Monilinia fructicola]